MIFVAARWQQDLAAPHWPHQPGRNGGGWQGTVAKAGRQVHGLGMATRLRTSAHAPQPARWPGSCCFGEDRVQVVFGDDDGLPWVPLAFIVLAVMSPKSCGRRPRLCSRG